MASNENKKTNIGDGNWRNERINRVNLQRFRYLTSQNRHGRTNSHQSQKNRVTVPSSKILNQQQFNYDFIGTGEEEGFHSPEGFVCFNESRFNTSAYPPPPTAYASPNCCSAFPSMTVTPPCTPPHGFESYITGHSSSQSSNQSRLRSPETFLPPPSRGNCGCRAGESAIICLSRKGYPPLSISNIESNESGSGSRSSMQPLADILERSASFNNCNFYCSGISELSTHPPQKCSPHTKFPKRTRNDFSDISDESCRRKQLQYRIRDSKYNMKRSSKVGVGRNIYKIPNRKFQKYGTVTAKEREVCCSRDSHSQQFSSSCVGVSNSNATINSDANPNGKISRASELDNYNEDVYFLHSQMKSKFQNNLHVEGTGTEHNETKRENNKNKNTSDINFPHHHFYAHNVANNNNPQRCRQNDNSYSSEEYSDDNSNFAQTYRLGNVVPIPVTATSAFRLPSMSSLNKLVLPSRSRRFKLHNGKSRLFPLHPSESGLVQEKIENPMSMTTAPMYKKHKQQRSPPPCWIQMQNIATSSDQINNYFESDDINYNCTKLVNNGILPPPTAFDVPCSVPSEFIKATDDNENNDAFHGNGSEYNGHQCYNKSKTLIPKFRAEIDTVNATVIDEVKAISVAKTIQKSNLAPMSSKYSELSEPLLLNSMSGSATFRNVKGICNKCEFPIPFLYSSSNSTSASKCNNTTGSTATSVSTQREPEPEICSCSDSESDYPPERFDYKSGENTSVISTLASDYGGNINSCNSLTLTNGSTSSNNSPRRNSNREDSPEKYTGTSDPGLQTPQTVSKMVGNQRYLIFSDQNSASRDDYDPHPHSISEPTFDMYIGEYSYANMTSSSISSTSHCEGKASNEIKKRSEHEFHVEGQLKQSKESYISNEQKISPSRTLDCKGSMKNIRNQLKANILYPHPLFAPQNYIVMNAFCNPKRVVLQKCKEKDTREFVIVERKGRRKRSFITSKINACPSPKPKTFVVKKADLICRTYTQVPVICRPGPRRERICAPQSCHCCCPQQDNQFAQMQNCQNYQPSTRQSEMQTEEKQPSVTFPLFSTSSAHCQGQGPSSSSRSTNIHRRSASKQGQNKPHSADYCVFKCTPSRHSTGCNTCNPFTQGFPPSCCMPLDNYYAPPCYFNPCGPIPCLPFMNCGPYACSREFPTGYGCSPMSCARISQLPYYGGMCNWGVPDDLFGQYTRRRSRPDGARPQSGTLRRYLTRRSEGKKYDRTQEDDEDCHCDDNHNLSPSERKRYDPSRSPSPVRSEGKISPRSPSPDHKSENNSSRSPSQGNAGSTSSRSPSPARSAGNISRSSSPDRSAWLASTRYTTPVPNARRNESHASNDSKNKDYYDAPASGSNCALGSSFKSSRCHKRSKTHRMSTNINAPTPQQPSQEAEVKPEPKSERKPSKPQPERESERRKPEPNPDLESEPESIPAAPAVQTPTAIASKSKPVPKEHQQGILPKVFESTPASSIMTSEEDLQIRTPTKSPETANKAEVLQKISSLSNDEDENFLSNTENSSGHVIQTSQPQTQSNTTAPAPAPPTPGAPAPGPPAPGPPAPGPPAPGPPAPGTPTPGAPAQVAPAPDQITMNMQCVVQNDEVRFPGCCPIPPPPCCVNNCCPFTLPCCNMPCNACCPAQPPPVCSNNKQNNKLSWYCKPLPKEVNCMPMSPQCCSASKPIQNERNGFGNFNRGNSYTSNNSQDCSSNALISSLQLLFPGLLSACQNQNAYQTQPPTICQCPCPPMTGCSQQITMECQAINPCICQPKMGQRIQPQQAPTCRLKTLAVQPGQMNQMCNSQSSSIANQNEDILSSCQIDAGCKNMANAKAVNKLQPSNNLKKQRSCRKRRVTGGRKQSGT